MKTIANLKFLMNIHLNKRTILYFFSIVSSLCIVTSCFQKDKNNLDKSLNDTLSVTKLLVQEIRNDLNRKPEIDSITEKWDGKLCTVHYRIDKLIENYQSISMVFGDINCDSLNDAITTIEYYTGGNRPEFTKLYIERTADGYKMKSELPLFGYRYVYVNSIENCVLELKGEAWKNDDPMCCPSIVKNFKVKLVGDKFEIFNENTEVSPGDPNAVEFEKAKFVADSLKQKYESLKHSLLKISYTEISEGKSSWIGYFDLLFKLNYLEKHKRYDENVETTTYEFYDSEGMNLWYLIDQQGNNSNITIWLKQHCYEKIFDTENNKFNYKISESDGAESFAFNDQIKGISKQDFTYDSDSTCYRLTVQKGEKGEFDSFWSELRIDSSLFVNLFGDK